MVDRNLIRSLDLSEEDWQSELNDAMEGKKPEDLDWTTQEMDLNQIVQGRVLRVEGDVVLVDVGYKSEGIIFRSSCQEASSKEPQLRELLFPIQRLFWRMNRPVISIPCMVTK